MTADYPYQTREVRDLAWACFAPPMLDASLLGSEDLAIGNCGLQLTAERQLWLEGLDRAPAPLLDHLSAQSTRRLGLYFEHLWHFFLGEDPAVELIAHNLAVREQGRTLGEFDCLYHCLQRDRHVHLELAVKFFLGYGQSAARNSPWQHWLGPNSQDRLDLKMAHLLDHQIRLGDLPQAQPALAALGITTLHREVVVKGYLFRELGSALPAPERSYPDTALELWVPVDKLPQYLADAAANRYLPLPRARWLGPAVAEAAQSILNGAELLDQLRSHFLTHDRPQLVAALDLNDRETRRIFVTGSHWPATRKSTAQ